MWIVCRLSVFCEPFTDRTFGFPYNTAFYIFFLHYRLYVVLFSCLVSPVLLKVYEVLALSM